jgi:hypothetical protein
MARLYQYVGPEAVRAKHVAAPPGWAVCSVNDLRQWVRASEQRPDGEGVIAATFVVDEQGTLRVADRRSEHVACAGGGAVLSAGEMFVRLAGAGAEVVDISNHSTGYCPEPESWPAVAAALDRIPLPHPGRFTREVVFRLCPKCGQRNVVKEGWLHCGVCGGDLPEVWNLG